MAQVAAGRCVLARALLEEFLGPGLAGRKNTTLAQEAREWLGRTDSVAPTTLSPSKKPPASARKRARR